MAATAAYVDDNRPRHHRLRPGPHAWAAAAHAGCCGDWGETIREVEVSKLILWFMRRPYFHIYGDDGSLYMGRWWILGGSNPDRDPNGNHKWPVSKIDSWIGRFIAIRLHYIAREDKTRDMHNHPASFISLVIKGWYLEARPLEQKQHAGFDRIQRIINLRRRFSICYRSATDRHTIINVSPGGCWTIVLWFRKKASWGFHTATGFVHWKDYKESA